MRLIDADKLIEEGWILERHGESNKLIGVKSIADVPTVEAKEVVYGEWESKIMNYFCSCCRTAFDDDLAWITGEYGLPNFCPECGADMGGEKHE